MTYEIVITIRNVESDNYDQLETLCNMMAELCETVCRVCEWDTVKRYDVADYELKEAEE